MSKPILVLNCGSSSIKYQMIDADTEEVLAKGLVQRIATGTVGTIDHEVLGAEAGGASLRPRRPASDRGDASAVPRPRSGSGA